MNTGALIMMVLALSITWGGAAICIGMAMRARKRKQ